jgi:pyruvate dehydrogenase E1 component
MGATAGRTTLNGEGLQHGDGHSQLLATVVPNVVAYDPAWAYEVAVIIEEGLRRMVKENEDVFYYVTLHNEGYEMPPMPEGAREGVLRGLYRFRKAARKKKKHVQLFGSGSILPEVLRAADLLAEKFGVTADVWSATSYQQLRADALAAERWNRLHPEADPRTPYVSEVLADAKGPVIAASDYMKTVADQIARWVPGRFVPLGTDGYGMSDTRAALRRHFEVDAASIAIAALDALKQDGAVTGAEVAKAIEALDYDPDKIDPIEV